jgi:hypothetical protein
LFRTAPLAIGVKPIGFTIAKFLKNNKNKKPK